jgi:hypothetical protein
MGTVPGKQESILKRRLFVGIGNSGLGVPKKLRFFCGEEAALLDGCRAAGENARPPLAPRLRVRGQRFGQS